MTLMLKAELPLVAEYGSVQPQFLGDTGTERTMGPLFYAVQFYLKIDY